MSDQSIVKVSQADHLLFIGLFHIPGHHQRAVLDGSRDASDELQSIARHRIAEREACAMVAEDHCAYVIAAVIRARSDRVDDISYAGVGP